MIQPVVSTGQRPVMLCKAPHKEWKWEVGANTKSFPVVWQEKQDVLNKADRGATAGRQLGCDIDFFFFKEENNKPRISAFNGRLLLMFRLYWDLSEGSTRVRRERGVKGSNRQTQREFRCWSKSRVVRKLKMGPAEASLALLCLCSLGLSVLKGTASAAPTQVRTAWVLFITETWT